MPVESKLENFLRKMLKLFLQTVIEFLQKKGFENIEASPNTKITEEQYKVLLEEFAPDKGLRSEATQLIQQRQEQSKERKEAAKSRVTEDFVKTTAPQVEGPKVLGRIDLNTAGKPKQAEKPAPKKEVPVKNEPVPMAAASEKKAMPSEAPKKEPKPVQITEKKPVSNVEETEINREEEVFRLGPTPQVGPGLTVKGHIDLDSLNQSTRPKKKSREEKRREREEKNRPHTAASGEGAQASGDRKIAKRNIRFLICYVIRLATTTF